MVVAEGHWQTQEPKALVNGLPLGPKAVKVYVDVVHAPQTFIWRPTLDTTYLEECLMSFVAWPVTKVVFENTICSTSHKSPRQDSAATGQSSRGKLDAPAVSKSVATSSKGLVKESEAVGTKSLGDKSPATSPTSPPPKNLLSSQSPRRTPVSRRISEFIVLYEFSDSFEFAFEFSVLSEYIVLSDFPSELSVLFEFIVLSEFAYG